MGKEEAGGRESACQSPRDDGRISMQILHAIRRLTALFDYESAASMNNSVEARGLAILVFRLLVVEKFPFGCC